MHPDVVNYLVYRKIVYKIKDFKRNTGMEPYKTALHGWVQKMYTKK